jgi:imidazolonepropionase
MAGVLFTNVRQLFTAEHADATAVREDVALLVQDGCVARIGNEPALRREPLADRIVDCNHGVITPGFIDSHTHAVFGVWRSWEYALRARGVPYMEIARRGGGIHASVRDVRARSEDDLVALGRERVGEMIRLGTTTAEIKSGYGLDTDNELKQLRAIRRLAAELPIDIVPTFLGAHEFPAEYGERHDAYVDLLVEEMIPAVAAERLAVFCDVFMEPGVFDAARTRRILEAGTAHGLIPKLHDDKLEASVGPRLPPALGAASADHLGAISDAGIASLAASATVATLLPGTLFFLGRKQYAPARALRAAGAALALATDFNPGSSPSPSMPLVLTMACSQMGLDPLEALYAATAGGARALRIADGRGTLRPGAPADLVVWNCVTLAEVPYRYGAPPIASVWKRGERIA